MLLAARARTVCSAATSWRPSVDGSLAMAGTAAGLSASAGIGTDGTAAADEGFRDGRTEDEPTVRVGPAAALEVAADIAVRPCGTGDTGARSEVVQPAQTATQRI